MQGYESLFWVLLPVIVPVLAAQRCKQMAEKLGESELAARAKDFLHREHRGVGQLLSDAKANAKDGRLLLRKRDAHFYLARAARRFAAENKGGALRALMHARQLDPDNSTALVMQCQVLSQLGRSEEAMSVMVGSLDAAPAAVIAENIRKAREAPEGTFNESDLANSILAISAALKMASDEATCPVCLDAAPTALAAPCGHAFCEPCVRRTASMMGTCPLCRARISSVIAHFDKPPAGSVEGFSAELADEAAVDSESDD
jgi:hypothetical protein